MVDKHRNYSVSLACAVCSGLFHPHHGREETSKYCGLKCSGVGRRGFQGAKTPKEKILKSIVVDPKTGCWNWIRSKKQSGYGLIRINGKETVAHRVSYEIFNNEPLGNLCACHHCDNPACVNPKHLFAGTPKDNALDKCPRVATKAGQQEVKTTLILNSKLKTYHLSETDLSHRRSLRINMVFRKH